MACMALVVLSQARFEGFVHNRLGARQGNH
jgi:hypothetical protein